MASVYAVEEDDVEKGNEEQQQEKKMERRGYIINPNGQFARYWDLYMVVLLLFTAAVTPFEVAFLSSAWDALCC